MKERKKPRLLFLIIALIVLLLTVCAVVLLIWKPWKKAASVKNGNGTVIHYYPADYEADVLQNRVYLSYDRDLYFGTQFDERQYHYETDRETASPEAKFFLDYFYALIHGDYEGIESFFVDGYFEEKPRFTMQMIHDMRVLLHSVDTDEYNGKETDIYNYTVTYEIFQNNGTWRQGVGNNDARSQIYQLILDENGAYKIFRILDITYQ